ncbi:hypothetical protein F6X40_10935 [Paraburkholderia sp. UCT31]|uniref:hypothetical protein n=1 Tax=Paraburkholderia sp. UCT31 TaxID=2615209 RepID=UPI0016552DD0|nr:hypothetical protein [Paraburkholderia sp. UCT31]MBC8737322.1 hypothetical protein [Paraburkholderia sp. UCT31]
MKVSNVYVGINGATIGLTSGKAIAAYPARKGEDKSHFLMESGKLVQVKGARINGVGVPRFLKESGFELAQPGDSNAERVADLLDVREGTELVEAASQTKAAELQKKFAGQDCTFVPFDESRPCVTVKVEAPRNSRSMLLDLSTGFSSGVIDIAYVPGRDIGMEVALSSGWLVGPAGDAGSMPRNTDYGGIVEKAVYVICNCGLGALVGAQNLVPLDNAPEDAPFPRGLLEIAQANGDIVQVGITGVDELEVVYRRAGEVLYSRSGMAKPRLGEVIGAIAAVLVRVGELDAPPVKKALKKTS